MPLKRGCHCPLLNQDCIELRCSWFAQVRGTNPNTGEPVDEWQCVVNLIPALLIENSQQQRSTAAAVESFRNESVSRSDVTNALVHQLARFAAPLANLQGISPNALPPEA
jgi:hypothetical protein